MKNCKSFYEIQTANRLQETIQHSPNPLPSDKIFLRLWSKNVLTEIYINIQTFAFEVLQECSSWASRNGAVQMFSSDTKQNNDCWNIFKVRKVFGCIAGAYYFQCQVS